MNPAANEEEKAMKYEESGKIISGAENSRKRRAAVGGRELRRWGKQKEFRRGAAVKFRWAGRYKNVEECVL